MKRYIIRLAGILLPVLISLSSAGQRLEDALKLSYEGRFTEADLVFTKLIEQDSNNIGFLTAGAFNNAWGKNFTLAKKRFEKALVLQPANMDAKKGLAYVSLYEASFARAARDFELLIGSGNDTEEFHVAAGLAYMNMHREVKASRHFEKVLSLNKSNPDATKYAGIIRSQKGILVLSAMTGLTSMEGENKFGLRQVGAEYRINAGNYIYARYDNSLSQDNYFLIKNKDNASAFGAGVYSRWNRWIGSKLEYGHIRLPQGINQNLFQTEQVIFLPRNFRAKLGGSFISSSQLPDEWMLMGGVSVPAGKKIRIEPYYYLIHRLYDEHRGLLTINWLISSQADISAGVFSGTEKNIKTQVTSRVSGVYAYSNITIAGPLSTLLLFRYEEDAFGRKGFVGAIGFKLAIDTKKF